MKYKVHYKNKQLFYNRHLYKINDRWFILKLKHFLDEELKVDVQVLTESLIKVPYELTKDEINLLSDVYDLYLEPIGSIDVDELLKILLENGEHSAMNIILSKFIL